MKVWNVTEEQIRKAADLAGCAIFSDWRGNGISKDGRALHFRLALGSERVEEGTYKADNGRRKPYPLVWQRRTANVFSGNTERRIASVCWHGHYAFMRFLLALSPEARIKTAFADYHGLNEFLRDAPETAFRNVGSLMYPVQMREACFCADYARDDMREIDEAAEAVAEEEGTALLQPTKVEETTFGGMPMTATTYEMPHAMIQACPHFIFSPEHYRADGSCRCDDPTHAQMREWGYRWNGSSWEDKWLK